jgi:hypothetical protein
VHSHKSIKKGHNLTKRIHVKKESKSKSKSEKRRIIERDRRVTFVLDGLALGGRGAPGDGARDEDDELLHARPLEVPEVAHVQRLR